MTSYIDNSNGETIRQPKLIAKNYIKSGFFPDFISTLPLLLTPIIDAATVNGSSERETMVDVVRIFRLMKLLRIRKLNLLIQNLQQPLPIKSQLKRIYVVFILVLICHVQGCILYAFLVEDEIWIPPLDFGTISTDVFDKERGFLFQYFKMFYHSTLIYAMVDVSGRTMDELLILSGLLIISSIINAVVFGQF